MKMGKYIITVVGFDKPFTTHKYELINNRIKFEDKFGNKKDFPQDSCFIEEVRE